MTSGNGQAPDPQQLTRKVALLAGMMTGAHVALMIALGLRLGLYHALASAGAVTSNDLARLTGLHERWLREWLRGQAAAGVLEYRGDERFELSPEVAALLADEDNLSYMGGNFASLPLRIRTLQDLPEAFRTGIGFSWDDRGVESRSVRKQPGTVGCWYPRYRARRPRTSAAARAWRSCRWRARFRRPRFTATTSPRTRSPAPRSIARRRA